MLAFTHLLFSVLCVLVYAKYLTIENYFLFFFIVLFTTLFVDIDEEDSTMGKRLQPFSTIIKSIFGHRGIFHTLLIPVPIFLTLHFFQYPEIANAIFLGYSSHLFMDMLTPAGIYLFYPMKWRIHGLIRVGSVLEWVLAFAFFLLILFTLLF